MNRPLTPRHVTAMRLFPALYSLSQTQRRLAHEWMREAKAAEAALDLERYRAARKECDRLWNEAKFNLNWARREKALS